MLKYSGFCYRKGLLARVTPKRLQGEDLAASERFASTAPASTTSAAAASTPAAALAPAIKGAAPASVAPASAIAADKLLRFRFSDCLQLRTFCLSFFGCSLTDLLGLSESRLLSARDFARTIGTGSIEIVESDSIHRTCATVVNRQAFGKLRSQTYSKFS